MSKWISKRIQIEAFKWTGDVDQDEDPVWINDAIRAGKVAIGRDDDGALIMLIKTLEGVLQARPGDYIVKGTQGELYPVKPDIFEYKYERVEG